MTALRDAVAAAEAEHDIGQHARKVDIALRLLLEEFERLGLKTERQALRLEALESRRGLLTRRQP